MILVRMRMRLAVNVRAPLAQFCSKRGRTFRRSGGRAAHRGIRSNRVALMALREARSLIVPPSLHRFRSLVPSSGAVSATPQRDRASLFPQLSYLRSEIPRLLPQAEKLLASMPVIAASWLCLAYRISLAVNIINSPAAWMLSKSCGNIAAKCQN
jgi:hypothetical protein